jgi:hypothetical protein
MRCDTTFYERMHYKVFVETMIVCGSSDSNEKNIKNDPSLWWKFEKVRV